MPLKINNQWTHGDAVYLVTDPEQQPRVVTKIGIWPGGLLSYVLGFNGEESEHFEFEISTELDFKKKTSN